MSLPLPEGGDAVDVLPDLASFARPRLRDDVPLMWRSQTSIQIGDHVVVDRVTRAHVAWMTSLDGLRSPTDIGASLTVPAHEARRLVRALIAGCALEDAARIPASLRWRTQPDRDIAAGRFGAALQAYRDLDLAFEATAARDACRALVVGTGALAEEVRTALDSAGIGVVDDHATIAILADAPHPDVPVHFDHPVQDLPHVHAATLGARAVVGPLVVPGATSCLRCAHLHRRDADPAWPLLAVQWSHAVSGMTVPPIDPLLARIAATHAALLVRTWADLPDEPATWSGFALELSVPSPEVRRIERPVHPLCGCRWEPE